MTHNSPRTRYIGICTTCGKKAFPTRKSARVALRDTHPELKASEMNVYQCGQFWHYGHRPYWRNL